MRTAISCECAQQNGLLGLLVVTHSVESCVVNPDVTQRDECLTGRGFLPLPERQG